MHCKPGTKEQMVSEDLQTLPAEQTLEQYSPNAMLTKDSLRDFTGFPDYRLTPEYSDRNGERMD